METQWYYADEGNTIGPFGRGAIAKMIDARLIDGKTQVVQMGTEEWCPLELSALKDLLQTEKPEAKKNRALPTETHGKYLQGVQELVCSVSGLEPLVNFKLRYLVDHALQPHSRSEVDGYFNCGGEGTTPALQVVSADWPRPWAWLRVLGFGLVVLVAFCFALHVFQNEKMIPGVIIVGAFFVPLACVTLFFELNILRNISLYQVVKFLVAGGIASMILALLLFSTTRLHEVMGAMSAGIVEEIAKVLTAVLLLRTAYQYRWILNGLLVGGAIGAGFAGFESAGYILVSLFQDLAGGEDLDSFYSTLTQRAVFAPFCHVVWTACIVGALWRVKGDQKFHFRFLYEWDFLRVLLFVMGLHMLWNSQILFSLSTNPIFWRAHLFLVLVSFVGSWYLLLLLVQAGLQQVKDAQPVSRISDEPKPEAGTG